VFKLGVNIEGEFIPLTEFSNEFSALDITYENKSEAEKIKNNIKVLMKQKKLERRPVVIKVIKPEKKATIPTELVVSEKKLDDMVIQKATKTMEDSGADPLATFYN
jgi:hypothetical protein